MSGFRSTIARLFHRLYYDLPARWLGGFVPPCRNVTFELTYRCNLTCDFCYLRVEEEKLGRRIQRKEELSHEELCGLLARLPRRSNVTFVGGEVTIKNRFWDLMEVATRRHRVAIGTNAVHFTDEICRRIVEAGVRTIGTSLDGPEAVHDGIRGRGTFQKTCTNIRRIADLRRARGAPSPRLNVNCVMIPENLSCFAEVAGIAREAGADSCSFQVLDPSLSRSGINLRGDIVESEPWPTLLPKVDLRLLAGQLDRVDRESREMGLPCELVPFGSKAAILDFYAGRLAYERYGCSIPWTTMRISPTGDVFPCLNYRVGNIREGGLLRLWNHPRYREFRNRMKPRGLYQSCAGCCKMMPRDSVDIATPTSSTGSRM